ncbi:MAG: hypothetical protein JXQ72_16590, partial [Anaerolineae bacterium]|nr:hypothetical protein [Anaerolineae bacterium]
MRIGPPTMVRLTVTRVFVLLAAILLLTGSVQSPVHGQSAGPPCQLVTTVPYHNIDTVCIEIMYDHITAPEAVPELTGLALAPDGTLYFARTASGEIWTMRDEDGDHFMEEPSLFADGLRFPTQMAVYDGAVYALAADGVWRLVDTDSDHAADSRVLVVDDLPNDAGFWPGAVGIGPDERLYVSVGAGCYACQDADARPGQLLSYALDGDDRRVEASGLRYPADFDWHPVTGDLWIVDSGV